MPLLFIVLFSWACLVFAEPFGPTEFCFRSCQTVIGAAQFHTNTPEVDWIQESCTNDLRISSAFLCFKIFCNPKEILDGLANFNETCRLVDSPLPSYSLIDRYTDDDINRLHHLAPEEVIENPTIFFKETVVISKDLYKLAFKTLVRLFVHVILTRS